MIRQATETEPWEMRQIDLPGWQSSLTNLPLVHWIDGCSVNGTSADVVQELSVTAILACVRFLAESIASMPMQLYRSVADGGRLKASSLPLYEVLHNQPNHWQSYFEWMEQLVTHTALWGNSYQLIVPGDRGFCSELWPLHPSRMAVWRLADGSLEYRYLQKTGETVSYRQDQILHVRWMSNDGIVGMVPSQLCRTSVDLARKLDEAAASYWENAARPSVVLETSQPVPETAMEKLRQAWKRFYGGTRNSGSTAVLPTGVTARVLEAASMEQNQYAELRKEITIEIARAYRVSPVMIGDLSRATYSNVEGEQLGALVWSLTPWQRRIEGAIRRSILSTYGSDLYCQIDSRGLLRGDSSARSSYYSSLFNLGAISPNDIRRLEDMDPIADSAADEYYVQLAMAPLAKAADMGQVQPPVAVRHAGQPRDDLGRWSAVEQAPAEAPAESGERSDKPASPVAGIVEVLSHLAEGRLTPDAAAALIAGAFSLTAEVARSIVDGAVTKPEQAAEPAAEPAAEAEGAADSAVDVRNASQPRDDMGRWSDGGGGGGDGGAGGDGGGASGSASPQQKERKERLRDRIEGTQAEANREVA